jgi:predicted nucleic acid-binding protein
VPRHWVVNASPLIILGKIGQLSLLSRLAESLVVPAGVAHELVAGPENDPARQWIAGPGQAHVRNVGSVDPIVASWDLGRGESHVLPWAIRHPGSEVLLDDFAARKCAAALSIPLRGTLGVLLLAKRNGHWAELAPGIERILEAGLHISPEVLSALRNLAGESR